MLLGEGGLLRLSASSPAMMPWKRASTWRDSRTSCPQARLCQAAAQRWMACPLQARAEAQQVH